MISYLLAFVKFTARNRFTLHSTCEYKLLFYCIVYNFWVIELCNHFTSFSIFKMLTFVLILVNLGNEGLLRYDICVFLHHEQN